MSCVNTTFSLSIHLLVHIRLLPDLAVMNCAVIHLGRHISLYFDDFMSLGKMPRREATGSNEIASFGFARTLHLPSVVAAFVNVPTHNGKGLPFPTVSQHLLLFDLQIREIFLAVVPQRNSIQGI